MKITDRQIGYIAIGVGFWAVYLGWSASRQNKEIIAHTKAIRKNLT